MKTQLLQDIEDSGALPPGAGQTPAPPRRRPRPAVWHWAQDNAAPQAPPPHRPQPQQAAFPSSDPRLADPLSDGPPAQAQASAGAEPAWLAELMRQDAARAEVTEKTGQWRRGLIAWAAGMGLLALAGAGGWWVLEERRVDGALVVVAETSPGPLVGAQPAAIHPVAPFAAVPAPVVTPSVTMPAPSDSQPAAAPPVRADSVPQQSKAVKKMEAKAAAERALGAHRRREETLLQCRALGYDERQCDRKACAMTRFGLACRG